MSEVSPAKDANLRAALDAWENANPSRDKEYNDAMRIRAALRETTCHEAFAWAALTCGRIAATRQQVDAAEVFLAEALGRFCLIGDKYGENLAISHLALTNIHRRNLDRALEFALRPLSCGVTYAYADEFLLHNNAANCYWAREEPHPTILHLVSAYNLVKDTSDFLRRSVVVGNIGATLEQLGEWELALSASSEAWQLQLDYCSNPRDFQLSLLGNIVYANCRLNRYETALHHADLLFEYLKPVETPSSSFLYDNLVEAFAINQKVEKAQLCLERSRALKQGTRTSYSIATSKLGEALVLEARSKHHSAIALAKELLSQPRADVMQTVHQTAARLLARCLTSLGRDTESEKWTLVAREFGREGILGEILSTQVRSSLKIKPLLEPLTAQELNCLSLSAHGQTSADIAIKLGIKTRTVNFHFTKILRKLNAMNRQEAIAKAVGSHLLKDH